MVNVAEKVTELLQFKGFNYNQEAKRKLKKHNKNKQPTRNPTALNASLCSKQ